MEARQRKITNDAFQNAAEHAAQTLKRLPTQDSLLVRPDFIYRSEVESIRGIASDRRLPPAKERPPASRLVSPTGLALRFYLTALFVAQGQTRPGKRYLNELRLDAHDPRAADWVGMVATTAEFGGPGSHLTPRDKAVRQIQSALKRLADPGVGLVRLPHVGRTRDKYEEFFLLHEGGTPYGSRMNSVGYTVPEASEVPQLPAGFIQNNWIHVLEDSEIVFLLMLAHTHWRNGTDGEVAVTGEARLLHFGLGRQAYSHAHRLLERVGLVSVTESMDRFFEGGKVTGFSADSPPELHRIQLLPDGFDNPALPTMTEAISRRLG